MFSHCLENTESPEVLAELEQFLCILCVSLEMWFWIFDDWSRLLKKLETPSVEMWFWIWDDQGRLPKKLNVILILDNQRRFCKKAPNTFWYCNKTPAEAPVTVSALKRGGERNCSSCNWENFQASVQFELRPVESPCYTAYNVQYSWLTPTLWKAIIDSNYLSKDFASYNWHKVLPLI